MFEAGVSAPMISPVRLTPSKARNRGSSELVEFCADAHSQQFVRQEAAQNPYGHDVLPTAPSLPQELSSDSLPRFCTAASSGLTLSCPSPAEIDAYAAVRSGSTSGASSYQGDSQPGSAASHDSAYHDGRLTARRHLALSDVQLDSAKEQSCIGGGLLVHDHSMEAGNGTGGDGLCKSSFIPGGDAQLRLCTAASEIITTKHSRGSSAPAEMELPDALIGARHSAMEEVDFVTPVSLSLTPIRTRTTEAQEAAEPTPVAYVEHLAEPPRDSSFPKVLPSLRPTINITATSTSASLAAPGAYNPYDRMALGGGYQGGGQSYMRNGGGPPRAATSSTSSWTSGGSQESHRPPLPPASLPRRSQRVGEQQAEPGRQPEGEQHMGAAEEVDFIVRVPGGIARRKPAPLVDGREPVEHVVMVPGVKRQLPATATPTPASTARSGENEEEKAACPVTQGLAGLQPGCNAPAPTSAQLAMGKDVLSKEGELSQGRGGEIEQPAVQFVKDSSSASLPKVIKFVLLAGAVLAAVSS